MQIWEDLVVLFAVKHIRTGTPMFAILRCTSAFTQLSAEKSKWGCSDQISKAQKLKLSLRLWQQATMSLGTQLAWKTTISLSFLEWYKYIRI